MHEALIMSDEPPEYYSTVNGHPQSQYENPASSQVSETSVSSFPPDAFSMSNALSPSSALSLTPPSLSSSSSSSSSYSPNASFDHYPPLMAPEADPIVDQSYNLRDLAIWLAEMLGLLLVLVGLCVGIYPLEMAGAVILGFAFMMACIRYCFSPVASYLQNIMVSENALDYISRYRIEPPEVTMMIECYHYETPDDSEGSLDPSKVKVITHTETAPFNYHNSVDCSGEPPRLFDNEGEQNEGKAGRCFGRKRRLVKMNLETSIQFADDFSKHCFEQEEEEFINTYKARDKCYCYWRRFTIPGVEPRFVALIDMEDKPWFLGPYCFLFSHFCLMQYFYILWLRSISVKVSYVFQKVVSRIPPPDKDKI